MYRLTVDAEQTELLDFQSSVIEVRHVYVLEMCISLVIIGQHYWMNTLLQHFYLT